MEAACDFQILIEALSALVWLVVIGGGLILFALMIG